MRKSFGNLLIIITLLAIPCVAQRNQEKKIDLELISFQIPSKMKLTTDKGIDSPFWSYEDEQNLLDIAMGQYVGLVPGYREEPDYEAENLKIGNTNALICHFRLVEPFEDYKFISKLYILNTNGAKFNISMALYSKNEFDKKLSKRIFQSIKLR